MVSSASSTIPDSPKMSNESGSDSASSSSYGWVPFHLDADVDPNAPAPNPPQASGSTASLITPATTARDGQSKGAPMYKEHLFSGPPSAERLPARGGTRFDRVAGISTHKSWGHLVTFDPRLQNADTLYDFIRHQALQVPAVRIKIQGAHEERNVKRRTIRTTQRPNGSTNTVRETSTVETVIEERAEKERVVDFDFWIDLQGVLDNPHNTANIHLCSVGPEDPAQRGTFDHRYGAQYRAPDAATFPALRDSPIGGYGSLLPIGEYSSTDVGCSAGSKDGGYTQAERNTWLWSKGLPLWTVMSKVPGFWAERAARRKGKRTPPESPCFTPDVAHHGERWDEKAAGGSLGSRPRLNHEQALRAWCVKYCQDPGVLKSFRLSRWYWGWETGALERAIRGTILSTGYAHDHINIDWDLGERTVTVRPPNFLSRLFWDTPWYLMPFIPISYPFVWLWQRLFSAGGAPYSVARASYAFKFYSPFPDTFPNESDEAAQDRLSKLHPELPKSPVLQLGPKGVHYLLGRKEGEWFREWEERIRMGVRMKYKGELRETSLGEHDASILDGY